jgi:pimeloyl-ACP methyl ester carboxylesterase
MARAMEDPGIWKDDPIAVPVQMILCAAPFSVWPADYEQQVRRLAANLEFHRLKAGAHCLMLERPDDFNALLIGFLKKNGVIRADAAADSLQRAPSRFAQLDNVRVHYKSCGEGRRAVVFVHGAFSDMTTWLFQVADFAGEARVILVDLPGHGKSDKPRIDYSIDLFARAVDAVLEDAGVEKAILVGHSMGTPVAYQFWRRYPEKMAALVAVEGMLAPLPFAAPGAVKELDGRKVRESVLRLSDMTSGQLPAEMRQAMKAVIASTPDHVAQSTMNALADPSIWKEDTIRVPVQMIVSAGPFSIWPADYEQRVRKLAPNLEFHKIKGAGHCLMLEKPKEFNALLGTFIAKQGVVKP